MLGTCDLYEFLKLGARTHTEIARHFNVSISEAKGTIEAAAIEGVRNLGLNRFGNTVYGVRACDAPGITGQ